MAHGIDIGGTKIEIASFETGGEVLFKHRMPTPTHDYKLFIKTIVEAVRTADAAVRTADAAVSHKWPVGIGLPGIIDQANDQYHAANVPCISNHTLQKDLEQALNRRVKIENDCKLFCLSEAKGSASNHDVVFGAILGTGVGGGICIDKKLLAGMNNMSGEWGHSSIPASLIKKYDLPILKCKCGKEGCIEQYISGGGLANIYEIVSGGKIKKSCEIAALNRENDTLGHMAFHIYCDILASSLVTVINIVDPDCIVFGGGMSNVDELYETLPLYIKKYMLSGAKVPDLIQPMHGDSSGVRGAEMLVSSTLNMLEETV